MDWQALLTGVSLVLVIEGILPFVAPAAWRRAMLQAVMLDNRRLRWIGLASMLLGLALLKTV